MDEGLSFEGIGGAKFEELVGVALKPIRESCTAKQSTLKADMAVSKRAYIPGAKPETKVVLGHS
jgi:hypothetical protein